MKTKTNKLKERNIEFAIIGIALVTITIAANFAIDLVQFTLFILMGAAVFVFGYFKTGFLNWYYDKPVSRSTQITGIIGVFLLVFLLGTQASAIPFRNYITLIGIALTIPLVIDYFRK